MAKSGFALVLIFAVVIFASHTLAKPQSEHDQLEKIRTERSNTPGGGESFPLNASASFPHTTSSPRKRVTRAVNNRYVQTPGIGRHIIHNHARTWHEARQICRKEGGDLAVVNSESEALNLAELMAESYPHYGSHESNVMLVGFNDEQREGNYVTVDGRTLWEAGFAEWNSGEPNNRGGNENCGSMRKNGLLNDVSCNRKFAFACELPLVDEVGPRGPVGPRGDAGIQGPAGRVGQRGEPGAKGAPGAAGENGSKGDPGSPGTDGWKGEKGDLGVTGPPGPVGPVGPPGSDGAQGLKGDQGEPGIPGPAGLRGEKGDKGAEGASGSPGNNGVSGHNGFNGKDGSAGAPGLDGSKGELGEKGEKGDVGLKGDVGPSGPPVPIGLTGPPGPPGPPGQPGFVNDTMCLAILSHAGLEQHPESGLIDGGKAARACFPNSAQRDGLKETPAKTCKDLFLAYPDKPNGEYWIDPNEGDISDAIPVYCDAETRKTCIPPESSRSPNISYTGDEPEVWLSEIEDGMKIAYTVDASQIIALQALSSNGQQNVTYHCVNSVGYFDTENQTNERGLKLLAWNDIELGPRGSRQFRYDMISDGCRDRLDKWKETVIAYRTDKAARLPVTDVYLRDVGKPGQSFAVEIGEVCFG